MSHSPHCAVVMMCLTGQVVSKRKINLDVSTQLSLTHVWRSQILPAFLGIGIFFLCIHNACKRPFSTLDANRVTKQAPQSWNVHAGLWHWSCLHFMVPSTDKCHIPVLNRWIHRPFFVGFISCDVYCHQPDKNYFTLQSHKLGTYCWQNTCHLFQKPVQF